MIGRGFVAPGFEEVREEFERNFAERGELGAAVAAYWRGEKVVDLWGGRRAPAGDAPWNEDTMVCVMSSTKGLSALALALARSRGWLDYDAPVARYWPEFAQHGKRFVTVRQLLGHEAGLVLVDEPLTIARMRDLDDVARLLARQTPAWTPGSRHGYHTMSLGLYMQELVRHVDPKRRTLGRFFHEELAIPLGLDFYIGLPPEIPDERIARVKTLSPARAIFGLRKMPRAMIWKMVQPGSMLRRSFLFSDLDWNDRRCLEVELPAGNGVGTARSIARAYAAFADGGAELGITADTMRPARAAAARLVEGRRARRALHLLARLLAPRRRGAFRLERPHVRRARRRRLVRVRRSGRAPRLRLRDEKLDYYLSDDPREKALRDAIYRAVHQRTIAAAA